MTKKQHTILTICTTAYLLTVCLTNISLVGYWTDILLSVILVSAGIWFGTKLNSPKTWLSVTSKTVNILSFAVVFGLLGHNLINPFSWDTLKTESFYCVEVEGRLFQAYFRPVGAYEGGEGNFWITESPIYFPIIEVEKMYDRTVTWDFSATEWEGEPIDQKAVVKNYIQEEVIDQEK